MTITNHPNNDCRCCAAPTDFVIIPCTCGTFDRTVLLDSFTDSDDTTLESHTPDTDLIGTGWVNTSGSDGTIQSNRARFPNGLTVIDVGSANGRLTCKVLVPESSSIQILFRYEDESNYHFLAVIAGGGSPDVLRLASQGAGGTDQKTDAEIAGKELDIEIEMCCDEITATINADGMSEVVLSRTVSFNNDKTKIGMGSDALSIFFGVWMDDLEFEDDN